jgi:hypothetical protein
MAVCRPIDALREVATALGLEDRPVRHVSINIGLDMAIVATVEVHITKDQLSAVCQLMRRYKLVELAQSAPPLESPAAAST